MATPMRALATASRRSATIRSGRRRNRSPGEAAPVTCGAVGIGVLATSSARWVPGVAPSITSRAFIAAVSAVSSAGTPAWAWVSAPCA